MNTVAAIFYRSYFVAYEGFHLVSVLHCCPLPVVVVSIVQLLIVCSNPHSFETWILGSLYHWQAYILPVKLIQYRLVVVWRGSVLVICGFASSDIITQRFELNSSKYSRSAWVGVVQDERTHLLAVVGCLHHELVLVTVIAEAFHALHGQTTISGNYHSWVTSGLGSSILLELLVWSIVLQLVCRDKLTSWQVQVAYSYLTLGIRLVVSKDDVLAVLRNVVSPVLFLVEVVVHVSSPIVVAAGIHVGIVSRTRTLSLRTILVGLATGIHSYRYTVCVYFACDASLLVNHILGYVVATFNGIQTSVAVAVFIKEVRNTIHVIVARQHNGNECAHHTTLIWTLRKVKVLGVRLCIKVR